MENTNDKSGVLAGNRSPEANHLLAW